MLLVDFRRFVAAMDSDEEYQKLLEFWGLGSYPRECQMIRENGEWRLEDIAEIFGW